VIAAPFELLSAIQAIVREELAARRFAELAVVTDVFPHADASDQANSECTVKLRDSGLELPHVPVATQRIGLAAIPNVDDLVLVTFVGGDLHAPVIVGRLYNDVDRAPVAKEREWVYISPDDAESGVRRLYLELPNGNTLTLDDDKALLDMGGTKVTISNGGAVEIDCQDAVTIKSAADMSLESQGKLALKAQGDVTVDGMSVALTAQTSAQLEGQASTTVKGPMVTLAGTTSFSPS
jgi:phage baseplate assembly protein gpV